MYKGTSSDLHETLEISLRPEDPQGTMTVAALQGVARTYGTKIEGVITGASKLAISIKSPTYYAMQQSKAAVLSSENQADGKTPYTSSRSVMSERFAKNKRAA